MRILLAAEHKLLRDGIGKFISELSASGSLMEACTFDEVELLARDFGAIDLALVSLELPGMNGIEGILSFKEKFPSTRLALLTMATDPSLMLAAISAGASGIISKTISGQSLLHALRLIMSGETYLSSDIMLTLVKQLTCPPVAPQPTAGHSVERMAFTSCERQVIPLLLDGLSNKSIAHRLGIEEAAVKARLRAIYKKLGVANRAQVTWALLANGQTRSH